MKRDPLIQLQKELFPHWRFEIKNFVCSCGEKFEQEVEVSQYSAIDKILSVIECPKCGRQGWATCPLAVFDD